MAFDSKTFRTRAGTAVVFVLVMLAGLLWNGWSFIILFTIIHFGCWYEYVLLLKKIRPSRWAALLPFGLLYITLPLLLFIVCGFPLWHAKGAINNPQELADHYSPVIPCGIILSIWVNDTMAYIVGSFAGKTPLTTISPKKTWEGTLGGAFLCVLIITLIGAATKYYRYTDWLIIATCCALFGTLGDLLESKLKRMAGVKDSGTFMPGHGGFLDRFDSLLGTGIATGIYVIFCM